VGVVLARGGGYKTVGKWKNLANWGQFEKKEWREKRNESRAAGVKSQDRSKGN